MHSFRGDKPRAIRVLREYEEREIFIISPAKGWRAMGKRKIRGREAGRRGGSVGYDYEAVTFSFFFDGAGDRIGAKKEKKMPHSRSRAPSAIFQIFSLHHRGANDRRISTSSLRRRFDRLLLRAPSPAAAVTWRRFHPPNNLYPQKHPRTPRRLPPPPLHPSSISHLAAIRENPSCIYY